jgi:hypothetical protein
MEGIVNWTHDREPVVARVKTEIVVPSICGERFIVEVQVGTQGNNQWMILTLQWPANSIS